MGPAPTRHLGANKGYASKHNFVIIKTHTLLSTTKCRVGAWAGEGRENVGIVAEVTNVNRHKKCMRNTYNL